jgi:hypothetical protein
VSLVRVPSLEGDFSLALWIDVPADRAGAAGRLVSKFDPDVRRGFTLAAISSAGGYNGPGDELRLSFGIDAGTEPAWTECGRPSPTSNYVSNSLTVFDGALFSATSDAPEARDRAHVYRYAGGMDWEDCGMVSREGAHGVGPLIVHRGALYAASWNYDWTRVHTERLAPCRVYRFEAPRRWVDCGQPSASRRIFGMGSYRGDLYAVGDDFSVSVHRGERGWEIVRRLPTYAHPLTVHDGVLYAGTLDPAAVWAFDGESWTDLGNPLGTADRCTQVHSLLSLDGALHMGSWPLGRVARWDAGARRWRDIGRLGDSTEINALAIFNGMLYGGSIPRAEVFRRDRDRRWLCVRRFFEPPGWRPVLVRNMEKPPDGDRRMREWTRVTSLTEHEGRLFASIGSCTSSAIDAPADVRGTVHAMCAGTVVTTSRALDPGWHHVVAVRRGRELALYVDGELAATRSGDVAGSIETAAPVRAADDPGGFHGSASGFEGWTTALDARSVARLAATSRSASHEALAP